MSDAGAMLETATADIPISRPKPLWSEQSPLDWWQAVNKAVMKLDAMQRKQVQSIGLSGQMHGATLLDHADKPLRPAILWNDGRSHAECDALTAMEPEFVSKGGNLLMPGFTAPKLEWVRQHEPELFTKIRKILLPKDYVRLCMTGDMATDASDAAGTLWMNIESRCWHEPLLEACGLNSDHMPQLYEGTEISGALRQEVAEAWGMGRVTVVAGGGDNAAGAVGAGVVNDGEALLSLGTSGVIFVACNDYRANPQSAVHAFCHALPERWHLMSVMLSAASCLDWACKLTGAPNPEVLLTNAEDGARFAGKEVFLPYLSGERTPHNNPHATGVLFGMDHDSGPDQVAQAVLEGVAVAFRDGFDALLKTGVKVDSLSVIGGGARSAYWGRIIAAALERPLVYREGSTLGPSFGAAQLARYSVQGGTFAQAFAPPDVIMEIQPLANDIEQLQHKHAKQTALYEALLPQFGKSD
jgi:xylulokinase